MFVIIFLAIVAAVPVVQTCYEFAVNPGHRVQMLDLAEDLFITPTQKAAKDAVIIDSLLQNVGRIGSEFTRYRAPDSSNAKNPQEAAGLCDEALTEIMLLKKSVIDYNRHVQSDANRWAGEDTLKPYYRALTAMGSTLDTVMQKLRSPEDAAALNPFAQRLQTETATVREFSATTGGLGAYVKLTLVALRRILVGADYLRPYEKEMEKSSVFANAVRPWYTTACYSVFRNPGSKAVQGTHGWLFYRPDVDYLVKPSVLDANSHDVDANDVTLTDRIIDTIVSFKKQLASRGIDLLFVIMPTKPSIYPDLLNPAIPPGNSGRLTHSLRMIEELRKAGVEAIDLFGPFAGERKRDAATADSFYLRTDTHFKARGVRLTASVIAGRIRNYPWFTEGKTEFAVDSVTVPRSGDIAEMIGLPKKIMPRFPQLSAPESTRCYQVYRITRNERAEVIGRTPYKDDYSQSSILVLGDSFSRIYQTDSPRSAGWIAHLALELRQPVASLVNDGGASTLVRETLARKPNLLRNKKLVVWEVVERDFRFGEKGWKDVHLQ